MVIMQKTAQCKTHSEDKKHQTEVRGNPRRLFATDAEKKVILPETALTKKTIASKGLVIDAVSQGILPETVPTPINR